MQALINRFVRLTEIHSAQISAFEQATEQEGKHIGMCACVRVRVCLCVYLCVFVCELARGLGFSGVRNNVKLKEKNGRAPATTAPRTL